MHEHTHTCSFPTRERSVDTVETSAASPASTRTSTESTRTEDEARAEMPPIMPANEKGLSPAASAGAPFVPCVQARA